MFSKLKDSIKIKFHPTPILPFKNAKIESRATKSKSLFSRLGAHISLGL